MTPVVEDLIGQPASPQVAAREGVAIVFVPVKCYRLGHVHRMLDRLHSVLDVAHSTVVPFVKAQNIEYLRVTATCLVVPFYVKHETRLMYAFIVEWLLLVIVVVAPSDGDSIDAVVVLTKLPPNWVELVLAPVDLDRLIVWLKLSKMLRNAVFQSCFEFVTGMELSLHLNLGAHFLNPLGELLKVHRRHNHVRLVLSDNSWLGLSSVCRNLLCNLVSQLILEPVMALLDHLVDKGLQPRVHPLVLIFLRFGKEV